MAQHQNTAAFTPAPRSDSRTNAPARQRRKTRIWDESATWSLLADSSVYALASQRSDGAPVLRQLNGVLIDGWLLFHGALAGEKMDCLNQEAVVSAYEHVASIPSYFIDPKLACPATTYFKSAMGRGRLQLVDDASLVSRMFQALMEKYQPEGGHAHFETEASVYQKELKSVRVFGIELQHVTGKLSVGQDRPVERTRRIVQGLYQRGAPGDMRAIETILQFSPDARPDAFRTKLGEQSLSLFVHPVGDLVAQHAQLLAGHYWRKGWSAKKIASSIESTSAWVGIVDDQGRLVAAARAVTDVHWSCSICDVVVQPQARGQGLGSWMFETLLRHPAVVACPTQKLGTADAMAFYERFGFVRAELATNSDFTSHAMVRRTLRESDESLL